MKKAQRLLNDLIESIRNKEFNYEAKSETEIDWSAYNLSKIHEADFFLTFVKEAIDGVQVKLTKNEGPGRPVSDAYDLAKILLMKEYFHAAERQAEGLAFLCKERLALKSLPSASTIGRAYSRIDVQEILGGVFDLTGEPIKDKETSFSADGTGLALSTKQNYANDRDDQTKHAGYDKALIMISNNFHIATGFVHADGTANDSPLFAPVFGQTVAKFQNISDVELDAGFVSRDNCQRIANANAVPYIFPKRGITLNQRGAPAWKKMLLSLIADPQAWLRGYHMRSQSECYFSSHKRRFTRPLLRRKKIRKGTEAFCRFIVTNITMLITAHFERRADVKQFDHAYL